MALLKSLIQRLLDSRTTPAEAGHSAMPSASETVLLTQNDAFQSWGNIYQGVAADDGYVNIFARSVNNTTSEMRVLTSGMTFSSAQTEAEKDMACSAPVAKGQTYTIKGIQVKMIKIIFVKALGAIGGGYNGFVRRALSCLRPSFNYLPRSFCKAKSLGLQNNQLLLSIRALIFLVQAPLISLPTPHRATAGRLLGAIQLQSQLLKSKSRTGRWHLLPYLTETLRELESVVTLKKGHRLSSCAVAEVQPIILFGSTKQVQTFNPLTGGALC